MLHDVCKPCSGAFKSVQIGTEMYQYWANPYHAKQSFNLILNDEEICRWIEQNYADPETVAKICKEHMRYKTYVQGLKGINGGMGERKIKLFETENAIIMPYLEAFNYCDDMLHTKKIHPEWFND